jgi:zinc transport system substrate-binding protein
MRRTTAMITLIALSVISLTTCKKNRSQPSRDKVQVVVTIPPLADFVRQVGGERVQVTTLLAPGASPHTFEPTPSQARAAQEAELVVRIGLDVDHWLEGLLSQDAPLVTATELRGIELISENGTHEGANPHIWLDPIYAKFICSAIADSLTSLDPRARPVYQANCDRYLEELDSLNARIEEEAASFASKKYVSFHPAWTYFARRYGLESAAVIVSSPGKEPAPKEIEEIVEAIGEAEVKAVFAEPQLSPKAAQVIAKEAGVEVLFLDPLGKQNESYIQLMDRNLEMMKQAMGKR